MNNADPEHGKPGDVDLHPAVTLLVGVLVLVLGCLELYVLCALWPTHLNDDPKKWDVAVNLFGHKIDSVPLEIRYLWLVAAASALGSYVHVATSFADYVGNRRLTKSWVWWYILRTPIGVALGVFFYFLLRAGLLTTNATSSQPVTNDINPYGITVLGALAGMFAKQATDKLQETFDTMFRTLPGKGDDKRAGKLQPTDADQHQEPPLQTNTR